MIILKLVRRKKIVTRININEINPESFVNHLSYEWVQFFNLSILKRGSSHANEADIDEEKKMI